MLQSILSPIGKGKIEVSPRHSNTGGLGNQIGAKSDWIAFCVKQEELPESIQELAVTIFVNWARHGVFGNPKGWELHGTEPDEMCHGLNGFKYGVYLKFDKEVRASIQWGGEAQNGWVYFELRGALVAILPRRVHLTLYRFAKRAEARLKRVDLALDDYQGKYFCPRKAWADWEADACRFLPGHRFDKGSRAPARDRQGAPETGETTYIGTAKSSIRLRIYDKGLEQQGKGKIDGFKNPKWVRWETEFRDNNDVRLDYRLLHPDYWLAYSLGASQKLVDIFGESGLRAVWLDKKPQQEPIEAAAKGGLSLELQAGVRIYYLVQIYGLQGFYDRFARPDSNCSLAGLTSYDAPAIDSAMRELKYPAAAPSIYQDKFRELAAGFGITEAAPCGGLRSSVPGAASHQDIAVLF